MASLILNKAGGGWLQKYDEGGNMPNITPDPAFKTFDFDSWEGTKQTDEKNKEIHNMIINDPDLPMAGTGESFNQAQSRVIPAIKNVINTAPANTVLLTHNSVYGLINNWDKNGRPNQFSKDQREEYTKQDGNYKTGDFFKIEGNNGPLFVIRHGETNDNIAGNFRRSNAELTDKGVKQAISVGKKLSNIPISEIITSPLDRTLATANIIASQQGNLKKNEEAKNGGWLEKYSHGGDNHGSEENANISNVSIPVNFNGEGYRNQNWKSPAWGGQFADGGKISQEEIDFANRNKQYISPSSNNTFEARQLNRDINRDTDISNFIKDMGTGAITMGTQFRYPTQEEIQQGRGSWSDRVPLLVSGITEGLKNEMLGAVAVKGAQALGKGEKVITNVYNNLQKENLKKLINNNNFTQTNTPQFAMGGSIPGSVGMSNLTQGRNYSPAWGGQFADGGKLTYQLWESITGTPWKTARQMGLTSGTYDENMRLRSRLINEGNFIAPVVREQVENNEITPISNLVNNRTSPENIPLHFRESALISNQNNILKDAHQQSAYRDSSEIYPMASLEYSLISNTQPELSPISRKFSPMNTLNPIDIKLQDIQQEVSPISIREPYVKTEPLTGREPSFSIPESHFNLSPIVTREPYQQISELDNRYNELSQSKQDLIPIIPYKVSPVKNNPQKEIITQQPHSLSDFKSVKGIKDIINTSSLPDDVKEVVIKKIENKNFETYNGKYFVLSKDSNQLYVFDRNHKLIDSTVAGRGKTPGDFHNTADVNSLEPGPHSTTRMGSGIISRVEYNPTYLNEFDTPFNRIKFNDIWKESEGLGLHGIYKTEYEFRKSIMDNPKIIDKLMSWGCINVPKEFLLKQDTKPAVGDSIFITPEPLRNLNGLGQKSFAIGGSLPGAAGFTYARTGDIPSNGKYAKKTLSSAENGGELEKLDQLLNFTNYNTPQSGGWLKQYK